MTIWFTSDNHWGHKNILKFCPDSRKFNTVEEMNQAMITRWNEQVKPEDTVYMLGDVFFLRRYDALAVLRQLNGVKHLVFGNHDEVIRDTPELLAEFASVQDYLTLTIDGVYVVLFHFPVYEWDRMHRGSYHLYGHVHGKVQIAGRAMDVGVDTRTDAGLWSWEEIHNLLKDREIRSHH